MLSSREVAACQGKGFGNQHVAGMLSNQHTAGVLSNQHVAGTLSNQHVAASYAPTKGYDRRERTHFISELLRRF